VATQRTDILLTITEGARDRRPVAITYTSTGDRRSERTVHPYGIVAHSGRWYVIGVDSATGTTRTFRLDRGSRHRRCWTARSTLRRDSTPPRKYCPDSPGAVPTPDLVAAKFG